MRILIVGADGTIGKALHRELRRRGADVVGTTRRPERAGTNALVFFDLASSHVGDLPRDADIVVICAAITSFAECRRAPDIARAVNLTGAVGIARQYIAARGRVLFLSSGAVFDGTVPFVAADAPHSPRGVYGRLKAEAEIAILALGPRASVLRPAKVLAPEMPLFNQWISALSQGERVEAFANHHISPIGLGDTVNAIVDMMQQDEGGIFQLSGAADISYADIARHFAERVGAPPRCVVPVAAERYILAEDVAPFNSLDASRLQALIGFDPPDPIDVLDAVFADAMAAAMRQRVAP